jgi:hypothetical protein
MKLSVQVDWSAPDLTEAKLWIGEKSTVLPRGQWTTVLRWSGERVRLEWLQAGRPTQQIGRRGFSLFDLLQQLGVLRVAGDGLRGVYVVSFPPLTLKVRSDAGLDAFRPDFFARLRCPAELTSAGLPGDATFAFVRRGTGR